MNIGDFIAYTWFVGALFTLGISISIGRQSDDKKMGWSELFLIAISWPVVLGIRYEQKRK